MINTNLRVNILLYHSHLNTQDNEKTKINGAMEEVSGGYNSGPNQN